MPLRNALVLMFVAPLGEREIVYAPSGGDAVLKRFESSIELELQRSAIWLERDGDRLSTELRISEQRREVSRVEFIDSDRRVDNQRWLERERIYRTLTLERTHVRNCDWDRFSLSESGVSPLVDRRVRFVRD